MTTPSRSFRRAVAQKKTKNAPRPVVEFFLEWLDDEDETIVHRRDVFHATMPSDERIFLIAAMAGDEEAGATAEAAAIMDLFKTSLPEDEYRILRQRLKDPEDDVNLEMLQEVVPWLMEEWSSFPTVPASASLPSPASTGVRSTGRAPGKGSTRSTSD
jgi:hypothetical protein